LASEVATGTITAREHAIAADLRVRFAQGWRVLRAHGIGTWFAWSRHVQTIVDLAYTRHRQGVNGRDEATERRVARLQERIARARARLPDMGG
jgi:hypothetical protein